MRHIIRLFLVEFILFIMSNTATDVDHPHQVTALIGGPIDMLIRQNFSQPVEVLWKVTREPRTYIIAVIKDNKLEIDSSAVSKRLEALSNGMGLRITNGTFNDRGNYSARITLKNHVILHRSFIVNLYEPVPAPTISTSYEKGKGNECNVTLHCSAPANTSLSHTWKYRHKGSDYQLYNGTGDTIQMSLQPESFSTEVLCKVQNPADSKNVTVKPCPEKGSHHGRHYWFLFIPVLFVFILGAACIKHCENVKLSIPETDNTFSLPKNNHKEEESLQVPESFAKYSQRGFISVRDGKPCGLFVYCCILRWRCTYWTNTWGVLMVAKELERKRRITTYNAE